MVSTAKHENSSVPHRLCKEKIYRNVNTTDGLCGPTVSKKKKKQDPIKPPKIVILESEPSSFLKTCITASVIAARASEETQEYPVGSA